MLNVVEYLLNLSQVFEVIRILETLSFAADAVDNGGVLTLLKKIRRKLDLIPRPANRLRKAHCPEYLRF